MCSKVAGELVKLAINLLDDDEWLTVEDVALVCESCADRMEKKRIGKIKASIVKSAFEQTLVAKKWKKLPKGWTNKSVESYWKSLVGDVKHKVTKCIKRMKDEGGITDPGAFCAALADRVEGTAWRHEPRKKTK